MISVGYEGDNLLGPMEFGLLGPLMVRCDGIITQIQRGKQRALLATLLLNANHAVRFDEIAESLWGATPPSSMQATIRNYVKRLRRALGVTGWDRISTHPRGYMISVSDCELDISRFEALLEAARTSVRGGFWAQAADQASTALSLWRGEPLADVESDTLAQQEVPRLVEMLLQAQEVRIDAGLHLGRHDEVTIELQRLSGAHPLRERLYVLLMLALYQCGRQAEALNVYQQVRVRLARELGTDPSAQLRKLYRQILTADPALDAPALRDRQPR
jgi:DNA-binding SARP family transcriptional activator